MHAVAQSGVRQTDNGFEFTNRFSNSKRDLPTLAKKTAAELNIRHSSFARIRPATTARWGAATVRTKKRFYSCHSFSLDDFAKQLSATAARSNNTETPPLAFSCRVHSFNMFDKPTHLYLHIFLKNDKNFAISSTAQKSNRDCCPCCLPFQIML